MRSIQQSRPEIAAKVLIIGEPGSGKTCLIRRYVHSSFQAGSKATLGVDFSVKILALEDCDVAMQLWDVAGGERHGQLTRGFYAGAAAAIVVCDVTAEDPFAGASLWKADLDTKAPSHVPCILAINKTDLRRCGRTTEMLTQFCADFGFGAYFETSAKDGRNVEALFLAAAQEALTAKGLDGPATHLKGSLRLQKASSSPKGHKKRCPC